jgi:menaquinone-dependent protoporphyrinogen oxidase
MLCRTCGVAFLIKALIVYGTRYGATANTSEIIAEELRLEGFEVQIINAKEEKIQSINDYDLLIVGSGIQMGRWTREQDKFLEKFRSELSSKKVALFVCCGSANPLTEGEEKTKEIEDAREKYLEAKAKKHNLTPIALGFFGGVYDFNKMSWFLRRTMASVKDQLEEAGYRETDIGTYDLRDMNNIRSWVKNVVKLSR